MSTKPSQCPHCQNPECDYNTNVDLQIRTTLWQGEGIVMACDTHVLQFIDNHNVIKIEKTALDITCGKKYCHDKAKFEVYLKQPNRLMEAEGQKIMEKVIQ